ncbi:MAG: hypothetical protein HOW73_45475 [Polyangiaceae bacterium]|nr:hypothetical protein [Polyangiaceae bacterium]
MAIENVSLATALRFNILTADEPAVDLVVDGVTEPAMRGDLFPYPYQFSRIKAIEGGYRVTLVRDGGYVELPDIVEVPSGSAGAVETAYERPLVVSGNRTMTIDSGDITADGRFVFEFASTGHAVGATLVVNLPSGLTNPAHGDDAIARDPEVVNDGDWPTYDPNEHACFFLVCTSIDPLRLATTLTVQGTPDETAPTLTSATVDASDPDRLKLAMSKRSGLRALTGLSLVVNAGAAVTMSSVAAGDGTDEPEIALSRNLIATDDVDLVIGSARVLQDLSGNRVATGTHSISLTGFTYTAPGQIHRYRGDVMTLSGTDVLQVNDGVGAVHVTPGTPKPQRVTSAASRQGWKFVTAGQYLKGDRGAATSMTIGTILVVWRTSNVATDYECPLALGGTDLVTPKFSFLNFGSTAQIQARRDPVGGAGDLQVAGPGNVLHADCITFDGSEILYYRDGNLTPLGTDPTDVSVGSIQRIALGIYPNLSANGAHGFEQYEVIICNQKFTTDDVDDWHSYAQSYHGTP